MDRSHISPAFNTETELDEFFAGICLERHGNLAPSAELGDHSHINCLYLCIVDTIVRYHKLDHVCRTVFMVVMEFGDRMKGFLERNLAACQHRPGVCHSGSIGDKAAVAVIRLGRGISAHLGNTPY